MTEQHVTTGAFVPTTGLQPQFVERRKLLADRGQAAALARQIQELVGSGRDGELNGLLSQYYPPDLADVMELLDDPQDRAVFQALGPAEQADVLDELDRPTRARLAATLAPAQLADIADELPADEAADILADLPRTITDAALASMAPDKAQATRSLLAHPAETAGGLMAVCFAAVTRTATAGAALQVYREMADAEPITDVYVVDEHGDLQGVVALRDLLNAGPERVVGELMHPVLASVPPEMDQEKVARIFARYDLVSLPVTEPSPGGRLLGIITSNDVIDVIQAEGTEDAMRLAGSDAEEMERRSPVQTALLRLPWIMATMFIELGAGFVIHFYDGTLGRVLLLASFMPIISAISGNTGLQSATIIVRGLSAGQVHVSEWRRAIARQLSMTLILGVVAGLALGVIGALWYGKWAFGLVVAVGMFAAVNIAGFVGTTVPLTSKRLGFDPAITSGPFETAFQDVVGISIFLSLATLMIHYLL